jgi:hypothetical protein
MKLKNIFLGLGLSLLMNTTFAQGGLEGIVVERYYQTNAADGTNASTNGAINALATGSVVYRVYVDMAAGYKFSQLYGSSTHDFKLNTTTNFYNDPNYGTAYSPGSISLVNAAKNTALIDSWFTVGGVCAGKAGVLKSEDVDGSIGNTQSILANNPGSCYGSPINGANAKDGLVASTAASGNLASTFAAGTSIQVLGITPTQFNLLDQGTGNSFLSNNGSIGSLGGVRGTNASNMVLVGQFTTNGVLSFELNVQIIAANGTAENWVAKNRTGSEYTSPSLTFSSTPIAGTVTASATSICTGASSLLTLTGNSGDIQWQVSSTSSSTGFTDIAGATSNTYNATGLTGNRWYRAKVSKSSCAVVYTTARSITVTTVPSIGGTLSSNASICINSGTTLNLTGSSGTRVWQYTTNWTASTPTWFTVSGQSATSLATGNLTSSRAYRVKLTSGSCVSYSNQVVVTVSPNSTVSAISGAGNFCFGSTVNLTLASATGTVQWQQANTPSGAYSNIIGANGLTYTISNLQSTRSYRAVVTSGACSSITSAVATVTCSPIAVGGTVTSNQAASVCAGTNAIFTLAGSTGTRQWQSSTNGVDFTDIPASAGLTKTINITVPTYVRVKLTSGPCAIAYSNVIFTNVTVAVGGTIASNKPSSVCSGTSTIFTSTGSTGTRQWQSSANGVDFTDLAASTGLTKTISVTSPIYVRLKLTNGTCASVAYSNVIFTDVLPNAVGGTISGEESVMVNTGTTLALTGSTGTIAWQRSTNGTTWTTISGQTTSSLATGNLSVSTSYRVKATVGTCFVYSPVFAVTVNSPRSSEISLTSFGAIAYPNPFADNFMLEVSSSTNEMIEVNVYDMLGKLVENHQVNVSDLSTFVIGNRFVSGVYNIEVIQGTQIERLRVVKN